MHSFSVDGKRSENDHVQHCHMHRNWSCRWLDRNNVRHNILASPQCIATCKSHSDWDHLLSRYRLQRNKQAGHPGMALPYKSRNGEGLYRDSCRTPSNRLALNRHMAVKNSCRNARCLTLDLHRCRCSRLVGCPYMVPRYRNRNG